MYMTPRHINMPILKSPGRMNTIRISMKIIIILSAPNSICLTLPISEYKLQSMITKARIEDKREISITNIVNSPL